MTKDELIEISRKVNMLSEKDLRIICATYVYQVECTNNNICFEMILQKYEEES